MGVKNIVLLSVVLAILMVGCAEAPMQTPQSDMLQQQAEQEPAPIERPIMQKEPQREAEQEANPQVQQSAPIEEKKYGVEELAKDINEIMGTSYLFKRDVSEKRYVESSELKYYVIDTLSKGNEVKNPSEFCDEYCAQNWQGWRFYSNASHYRALVPVLQRENFSSDSQYRDYRAEVTLVEEIILEREFELEHGKVLEYQYILWAKNAFDYFEGAYADTLLLYKVYCTPNMTVFLRPKWDGVNLNFPVAKMDDVKKTWENYIVPLRENMLEKADEVLEKCGMSKEFFEGMTFPDHSQSQTLSVHWRPYYKFYANVTREMAVGVVPKNDEFELFQVNVSITNYEYFDFGEDLNLRIEVSADSKEPRTYYEGKVASGFAPGKSIVRSYNKDKIRFEDNITVDMVLYTVDLKGEIRPYSKTFLFKEE